MHPKMKQSIHIKWTASQHVHHNNISINMRPKVLNEKRYGRQCHEKVATDEKETNTEQKNWVPRRVLIWWYEQCCKHRPHLTCTGVALTDFSQSLSLSLSLNSSKSVQVMRNYRDTQFGWIAVQLLLSRLSLSFAIFRAVCRIKSGAHQIVVCILFTYSTLVSLICCYFFPLPMCVLFFMGAPVLRSVLLCRLVLIFLFPQKKKKIKTYCQACFGRLIILPYP